MRNMNKRRTETIGRLACWAADGAASMAIG